MRRIFSIIALVLIIFMGTFRINAAKIHNATDKDMADAEVIVTPVEAYRGGEYISGRRVLQIQYFHGPKWYVSVMNANGTSDVYGTFTMSIFGDADQKKCSFQGIGANDATGQKIWFLMTFDDNGLLMLLFPEGDNESKIIGPYDIIRTENSENFLVAENLTSQVGKRASISQLIKWLSRPLE